MAAVEPADRPRAAARGALLTGIAGLVVLGCASAGPVLARVLLWLLT